MRILITGGLGFIGTNLISYLVKKDKIKQIIIVDNKSKSNTKYLDSIYSYKYFNNMKNYKINKSRINVINADTKNSPFANKITRNIDCVIHLAAESGVDLSIKNPRKSFDININGTFNYLDACRTNNVRNFIFASSGSVFGDAKPPMSEMTLKNPISTYGSSKLSIETFCETYSKIFEINTTILRFSNAYGPYSSHKKSIVANFSKNIINEKPISINGDGKTTRDYIHVSDIVKAIYNSLNQKDSFQDFNISTGKQTSINTLLKNITNIFSKFGYKSIIVKHQKERKGDMRFNSMSSKKYLNYYKEKKFINLNDGLISTIEWFIQNYK